MEQNSPLRTLYAVYVSVKPMHFIKITEDIIGLDAVYVNGSIKLMN